MADIEKARAHGDRHPNGKWYWESAAAGGKGDWRTIKNADKKPAEKKESVPEKEENHKEEYWGPSNRWDKDKFPNGTKVAFVDSIGKKRTGTITAQPFQNKNKITGKVKLQGYTVKLDGQDTSLFVRPANLAIIEKAEPLTIEKAEDLLFGPVEPAPRSEIEKAEDALGL